MEVPSGVEGSALLRGTPLFRDIRYTNYEIRDTRYDSRFTRFALSLCSFVPQCLCGYESIMQNKPNFQDAQMSVNSILTKDYERNDIFAVPENKPNSNPNKANLLKAKMNVNKVLTKDYENRSNWALFENEPNTKPIQTQLVAAACPS